MKRLGKTAKISLTILALLLLTIGAAIAVKGPSILSSLRESAAWALAKPIARCSEKDFNLEARTLSEDVAPKGDMEYMILISAKDTVKYRVGQDGPMWANGVMLLEGEKTGKTQAFPVVNSEGLWEDENAFLQARGDSGALSSGIISKAPQALAYLYFCWPGDMAADTYKWSLKVEFFGIPLSTEGKLTIAE